MRDILVSPAAYLTPLFDAAPKDWRFKVVSALPDLRLSMAANTPDGLILHANTPERRDVLIQAGLPVVNTSCALAEPGTPEPPQITQRPDAWQRCT